MSRDDPRPDAVASEPTPGFTDVLERAIDELDRDASFHLEGFLALHAPHADLVRAHIGKLRRAGMLHGPGTESLELPHGTLLPARTLGGRYRVLSEIGSGGMGRVFLARDERLARDVAIKIAHGSGDDPTHARLEREARILALLEHPGIVAIYDGGTTEDGRAFCAMRVVGGRTVHEIIALAEVGSGSGDGLGLARKVQIALAVCDAIGFAHDRGIVHRDLKPANVMLGSAGEIQVIDWGLAKRVSSPDPDAATDRELFASFSTGAYETVDGYAFGTPSYCAPEQARGEIAEIDERSDVFGLGAILHHLLAGRPPYYGKDRDEVLERARAGRPNDPDLSRAAERVPAELVAVCQKACAPGKDQRYAGAHELAGDLRAFLEKRTVAAYEVGTWAETKKWLLRNRTLAASLLVALLALVAGTTTSLAYARREAAMRVRATQSAEDALHAKESSDLSAGIARELAADADAVSEHALKIVASLSQGDDRETDEQIVRALLEMADANKKRGRYVQAEECAFQAMEFARKHEIAWLTIRACVEIALIKAAAGDLDGAEQQLGEADKLLQEDFGLESDIGVFFLNARGNLRRRRGDIDGAIDDYTRMLSMVDAIGCPANVRATFLGNLATAFIESGNLGEARARIEEALRIQRADSERPRGELLQSVATAASIAMAQRRWSDAEPLLREAVVMRELLNGPDSRETLREQHNLAAFFIERGNLSDAEALLGATLRRQRDQFGSGDVDVLDSLRSMAELRSDQGRRTEALELCREACSGYVDIGTSPARLRSVLSFRLELERECGDPDAAVATARALVDVGPAESEEVLEARAFLDGTPR